MTESSTAIAPNTSPGLGTARTVTGHLPITEAAKRLGVKPWEVVRLIEEHELDEVRMVDAASLDAYIEENR